MRQLTFQEHMLFPSNLKKMKEMARWENYRLLHRTGALEDKPEVITEEMDITKMNKTELLEKCKELGITLLWGVGGDKIQSSSWLLNKK